MAAGNELAQLMKMTKKTETTLDKNVKKMALMATTLQTLIVDKPTKALKTYKANY